VSKSRWAGILAVLLLLGGEVTGKQYAIVVGIDQYRHAGVGQLTNLKGAVNDAKLVSDTLVSLGVDLPPQRILINEKATVDAFRSAWKEVTEQARPGDSIIFTFAGHGGRETEFAPPYDEKDIAPGERYGKDETLMFHEFEPTSPHIGRISDDELYELFAAQDTTPILFVADACHAGGLTRSLASAAALPSRGVLDDYKPEPPSDVMAVPKASDSQLLEHVTYLAATADEALKVNEIPKNGKAHGALSWYFSQAISGAADRDGNQIVTRKEMAEFLETKIAAETSHRQRPGLLPRSNETPAFSITSLPSLPLSGRPSQGSSLFVRVDGGQLPEGLDRVTLEQQNFQVRFEISGGKVSAYNAHGDRVSRFDADDLAAWRKIVAKYRLLQALDQAYNVNESPIDITLEPGDSLHPLGGLLSISIHPNSSHRAMVLFDLTGTGELQFLYPYARFGDAPYLRDVPHTLRFRVEPPVGEDDVVAIFCEKYPADLVKTVESYHQRQAPDAGVLLDKIDPGCQIGRYAFFTTDQQ